MSNVIDSIKLSGTVYTLSAQTEGGGVPESAFTAYTASTNERISQDEEVTAAALNVLNESLSGKQDTLSAGTNITISGNVISAECGGKAIEAGTGISVTTGTTADTISLNVPIWRDISDGIIEGNERNSASGEYSHAEGNYTAAMGSNSHAEGDSTMADGDSSHAEGGYTKAEGDYSHAEGYYTKATNVSEHTSGRYNVSNKASTTFGDSGNTLFSVGNGTSNNARHNAFEIRQNGDIYLSSGGTDIKLQDHLGGSSITVDTELDSGSTNPVENRVIYNKIDEVEQVTAAGLNALNDKITPTVELTQAQYDALTVKDPNTYYIITDAQAVDLTNYYTKTETDNAITAATSTKQDTLVSGTNIKTINNESLLGSGNIDIQGGGKAIEAGRGISVTTGETADTISFSLPISADTDGSVNKLLVGSGNTIGSDTNKNIVIGDNNTTEGGGTSIRIYSGATIIGYNNYVGCNGQQNDNNDWSTAIGRRNKIGGGNTYIIGVDNNFYDADFYGRKKNYSYVIGRGNTSSLSADGNNIFVFGAYNKITKSDEFALGEYNASSNDGTTSGNTFFSIGNGTSNNARHNAFEIRQNGDIYLTKDGQDVKLQDQLGGSSITVDTALDSGSTNPVENRVIYNKIDEVEQVTAASLNALNDNFGGLKLVKLSQTQYDELTTKDPSTLYVIVD